MIFEKLANGITKHAKLIVIIWVIVLIASIYPALHSTEHLSYSSSSMGGSDYESVQGSQIISEHFPSSSTDAETMAILLVTYDHSTTEKTAAGAAVATYIAEKINSSYGKGVTALALPAAEGMYMINLTYEGKSSSYIQDDTGDMRSFVKGCVSDEKAAGVDTSGIKTYLTGSPAISYDASTTMSKDMSIVDPISILLILILVGLFFRSFVSSAAPPITIGVAFALVMCAMFFLGQVLEIYYIVEMLLLVSMLGAGCDYCIFILSRYREERRAGKEHIEAARQAIMWAGESVFTSGLAVMIGFGSMYICDFNIISTMGIGLAVGIVFALLAALTLMSSLVVLLGDRLFWPSGAHGPKLEKGYLKKMGEVAQKYFTVSTRFSVKHAKAIIVAVILFTVPMVYVYATANNSYDMIGSMMSGESADGMTVMTDYVEGGSVMPNYAVIETEGSMGTVEKIPDSVIQQIKAAMSLPDDSPLLATLAAMGYIQWSSDSAKYIESLNKVSDTTAALRANDSNIGSVSYLKTWTDIVTDMTKAGKFVSTTTFQEVYAYAAQNMSVNNYSTTAVAAMGQVNPYFGTTPVSQLSMLFYDTSAGTSLFPYLMDYIMLVKTGMIGTSDKVGTDGELPYSDALTYAKVSMSTKQQAMADDSIKSVNTFTSAVHNYVGNDANLKTVWITGTAAVMVEISNIMNEQFLKIELTAIILIILLLFFVMKSYLTPIRSVVTIFMSVIWTVAITHLVFTNVLHDGVLWMLPIILLVICLGLGMDYDILLTTRIREYRFDKGMSNEEAIHQAVLHSGSVITICGFIMAGTFGTMMLSSTVMLQQMGFALCFAILIDALVVRTYIVPAAMYLMGEWNWKGPKFLHKKKDDETQQ